MNLTHTSSDSRHTNDISSKSETIYNAYIYKDQLGYVTEQRNLWYGHKNTDT